MRLFCYDGPEEEVGWEQRCVRWGLRLVTQECLPVMISATELRSTITEPRCTITATTTTTTTTIIHHPSINISRAYCGNRALSAPQLPPQQGSKTSRRGEYQTRRVKRKRTRIFISSILLPSPSLSGCARSGKGTSRARARARAIRTAI